MDPIDNLPKGYDPPKNECNKCNTRVKSLYNHNYNIHQERNIPCPSCGKMFKRKGHLNAHMRKHNAQPTQCNICATFVLNMDGHKKSVHVKEKLWHCVICNGKYKTKNVLKMHIAKHGAKPEKCSICDLQVNNIYGHNLRAHSEPKLFTCSICGVKINNKGDFKKHQVTHENQPTNCNKCNALVKNMFSHNYYVHQERQFVCNVCRKSFKRKTHLGEHMWTHKNEKYKCAICPKVFFSPSSLKGHQNRNHGDKDPEDMQKCNVCSKEYNRKYMKIHKRTVHNLSKFLCRKCRRDFFNKTNLDNHVKLKHTYTKSILCTFQDCDSLFKFESEMVNHRKRHQDVKPLLCNMCDKSFKYSSGLNHHILVHTGERPHKCQLCSFDCRDPGVLRRHQYTHSSKKLFDCESCGKAFKDKGEMRRHKKNLHVSSKMYSCEQCEKTFTSNRNMQRHAIVHSGEKPFGCSKCGNKFKRSSQLKSHLRIHTEEKPFSCQFCEKKFSGSRSVKHHLKTHTGENHS